MSGGDEVEYGLVMPFVVVQSRGGPFDDSSYAAGWEAGTVDKALDLASIVGASIVEYPAPVHAANLAQFDLIAMRRGYVVQLDSDLDEGDEWAQVRFVAAGESTP